MWMHSQSFGPFFVWVRQEVSSRCRGRLCSWLSCPAAFISLPCVLVLGLCAPVGRFARCAASNAPPAGATPSIAPLVAVAAAAGAWPWAGVSICASLRFPGWCGAECQLRGTQRQGQRKERREGNATSTRRTRGGANQTSTTDAPADSVWRGRKRAGRQHTFADRNGQAQGLTSAGYLCHSTDPLAFSIRSSALPS